MYRDVSSRIVGFLPPATPTVLCESPRQVSNSILRSLLVLGFVPFLFVERGTAQVLEQAPRRTPVPAATPTTTDEATQKRIKELTAQLGDEQASDHNKTVNSLREIGQPAVGPLIEVLNDTSSRGRGNAAFALGQIGDPRAVRALITALEDKSDSVSSSAAEALGRIGDPQAVQPLIRALEDRSGGVQTWAAEALGKIGDPQAVRPLIEALWHESHVFRKCIASALREIGDPQAVTVLIGALEDNRKRIRRFAAEALGRIGDPRAVGPLTEALEDKDESVRRYAAAALRRIDNPRASRALRKKALARKTAAFFTAVLRLRRLVALCCSILLVAGLFYALKSQGQDTATIRKEMLAHLPLVIGAVLCPPVVLLLVLVLVLKYGRCNTETGLRALRAVLVYLASLIAYLSFPYVFVQVGLFLSKYLALTGIYCFAATYGIYVLVRDTGCSPSLSWLALWAHLVALFLPLFVALYVRNVTVKHHCFSVQAVLIVLHASFHIYLVVYHDLAGRMIEMVVSQLGCNPSSF